MLFNEIKLGYPSLWLKTTESMRAVQSLTTYDFRTFFTMDFELGFSQYIQGTWRTVLIDILNLI